VLNLAFRRRGHHAENQEERAVEGERHIPSVNTHLSIQSKLLNWAIFLFITLFTVFLMWKYYAAYFEKKREAAQAAARDTKQQVVAVLPPLILPPPPAPAPTQQPPAAVANALAQPSTPTPPPAAPGSAPAPVPPPTVTAPPTSPPPSGPSPAERIRQRRLAAPVLFQSNSRSGNRSGNANASAHLPAEVGTTEGIERVAAGSGDELSSQLRPVITPGTQASVLADRNLMIAKGGFLDCVMESAIDTSQPGMVSCLLSRPAYSDNGHVILLDRGTKLTGEYKQQLRQGQARVFILWTRAKTPQGVLISLDSPGTDALGRAGVDGYIDTHFWERFGGALLLSVVDDAVAALARLPIEGNNNAISYGNTADSARGVAAEVIRNTINIPPTLRKNQGDHINVYIARDLDFRSIYALKSRF
jgi:type IV secretion system protein VirB10